MTTARNIHPGGRSFGGPAKYVQKAGELARLGDHVASLGSKALLLADPFVLDQYGAAIRESMDRSALPTSSNVLAASAVPRRSNASPGW